MCDGEKGCLAVVDAVGTSGSKTRRGAFPDNTAESGHERKVLTDLGFDIGTEVITGIVISLDVTALVHVTRTHEVTHLLISALHRHIVLLGDAGTEDLLDVVDIVPAVGGIAVGHGRHILLGEIRDVFAGRCDGAVRHLVHHLGRIVIIGELGAIHELREIGIHGSTHGSVVGDMDIAPVALLGRDDDHAAGCLEAVHRSGSTVLQDGDAFDVGRVDVIDIVHREAVHDIGYTVNGTTDAERGLVQTRFTGLLHGGDTGKFTGQHLGDIGRRRFQEFVALDGRHGRRQGFLPGRTVADYDDILQEQGILLQDDVDGRMTVELPFPGGQAQAGKFDGAARRGTQGIGAVGSCQCAVGGALHQNRHAGKRCARRVGHLSAERVLGPYRQQGGKQKHQAGKQQGQIAATPWFKRSFHGQYSCLY